MSVFTPFLVLLSSPSSPSVASTTILVLVLLSSPLASTTILPIHLDSIRHLAMGINDLWDMLEPATTTVPIVSLALSERYIGPAPHSPFVVGIDASGWFEQCQQGKWHRAHAQTGMNPALRTFLFRLSRLAQYPVKLIFCYDGDQRPKIKRGHRVSTKDHWMVDPTQQILNMFNTQWITAAGEAEAQLGLMNYAGVIDAVMTDDSDVFVFGAHTVLRNSTLSTDATIKLYTTSSIQELVEPRLTGDAFTTIAICCGGDYNKKGLPGCGRETALGLVHCMDTTTLCDAVRGDNSPDQSLQHWRDAARYHLMNSFPDPNVIDMYVKPAVTPLMELPVLHSPAPPDLAPLALLIHNLLGWEAKKLVMFRSAVWPVVVLHEVLEDLAKNSPASDEFALASGCTRGSHNDVPIGDLVRATLQLLPAGSSNGPDDRTPVERVYSSVYGRPNLQLLDYMMPRPLSSATITTTAVPVATSSSLGVIDLTGDEEEDDVIDLTGEGEDAEIIDLTL
ncbi:PIN domain-like protein [Suillus subluteus]|nr:PIN domain-like protein [Suillus subluteus]